MRSTTQVLRDQFPSALSNVQPRGGFGSGGSDGGHCHWQGVRGGITWMQGYVMHVITLLPYGMDMRLANRVLTLQVLHLRCLAPLSLRMNPIFNYVPASWLSDSVSPALLCLDLPFRICCSPWRGAPITMSSFILPSLLAGIPLTKDCVLLLWELLLVRDITKNVQRICVFTGLLQP